MFFTFPEDTRWNAERQAVEFGVEIGEYSGVVRVRGTREEVSQIDPLSGRSLPRIVTGKKAPMPQYQRRRSKEPTCRFTKIW